MLLPVVLIMDSCRESANRDEGNKSWQPDTVLMVDNPGEYFLDSLQLVTYMRDHRLSPEDSASIISFYLARKYRYAWINKDGLEEHARYLMNALKNARSEIPGDTVRLPENSQEIFDSLSNTTIHLGFKAPRLGQLELSLTEAYYDYARRAYTGLPGDQIKSLDWFIPPKKFSGNQWLDSLLSGPPEKIAGNEPLYYMYDRLRKELYRYHGILSNGGWISGFDPSQRFSPGDSSQDIGRIKKDLFFLGDLTAGDTSDIYSPELGRAIASFRDRMGLPKGTQADSLLLNALNVPLQDRIRKILLNMERCRWLPVRPPGEYIVVNLPEFAMHVYDGDSALWSCDVIIGKATMNTVIFTSELKNVVFSPYWYIPENILAKETLPALKKNPGYLNKEHLEVVTRTTLRKRVNPDTISWKHYTAADFPYSIRQKPGKDNSLGYVKFLFPNEYDIYFHDTPSRGLFKKEERAFSHGCIRISEPFRLARFLLRDQEGWDSLRIRKAMYSGRELYVRITRKIPVYILYLTAWVDETGKLNFRKDIYHHDERLEKVLFSEPETTGTDSVSSVSVHEN